MRRRRNERMATKIKIQVPTSPVDLTEAILVCAPLERCSEKVIPGECAECKRPIGWAPSADTAGRKICLQCFTETIVPNAEEDVLNVGVTPQTLAEVKEELRRGPEGPRES
jgi:hypothetical protein